jgi:glutamyl-tRNA reductase
VPLITELRHQAEMLAQIEVEQTLRRLPELDAGQQEIIVQLAHRIVNKFLHTPTVQLKSRAAYGDHYDYAHAVRQLFALDDVQNTELMSND